MTIVKFRQICGTIFTFYRTLTQKLLDQCSLFTYAEVLVPLLTCAFTQQYWIPFPNDRTKSTSSKHSWTKHSKTKDAGRKISYVLNTSHSTGAAIDVCMYKAILHSIFEPQSKEW